MVSMLDIDRSPDVLDTTPEQQAAAVRMIAKRVELTPGEVFEVEQMLGLS
jgi:hypothetical protein